MPIRSLVLALVALAALTPVPLEAASKPDADRQAVQELTSRFLKAFEDLDMPRFIACFTEDATVFFPTPEPPERFEGRRAIESHFQKVFEAIRKSSGASGPPFHRLVPEDLLIQILDPHAAIVSFHLRNSERIARRTLVLAKVAGRWRIAHLHASNVPVAPTSR
jgi:uncharacterized protein (TIGR02246 family)